MSNRKNPSTSLDAYRRLNSTSQKEQHYTKIVSALEKLGSATADKIAEHTGMEHVQINRRMIDLVRAGKIYNTKLKSPTRRGRDAFVFALCGGKKKTAEEVVSDLIKNIPVKQPEKKRKPSTASDAILNPLFT